MTQQPKHVDRSELKRLLGHHLPVYRAWTPHYQATMLDSLLDVWMGPHARLLDIGGGTGVIAQAMAEFFPVGYVQTIDVVDRFSPTLSVATGSYDGSSLPFRDGEFDAATLNNVIHHVPVENRESLLFEIRRVVDGPLYIKDHESRGVADGLRLSALDAIGNMPFGGMLWARYLARAEWEGLAAATNYKIAVRTTGTYRAPPYTFIFPNRLEVTMRLEPM